MNQVRFTLPLAFVLLLTACVPGTSRNIPGTSRDTLEHFNFMDANYYGLRINLSTPGEAKLHFDKPGAFPDPEVTYIVEFSCNGGLKRVDEQVSAGYSTDVEAAKAYLDTLPNADYDNKRFRIKDFIVSCQDGATKVQGPDLDRVIRTLSSTVSGVAGDDGALSFFIDNGYQYPNIEVDYYELNVLVRVTEGAVNASYKHEGPYIFSQAGPSTVALTQNGVTAPILFDGKFTAAGFDPSKDAVVAVQRDGNRDDEWDTVRFNYEKNYVVLGEANTRPF